MPFIVHVQDGLDVEEGADDGRRRGHPPAPFEVKEVFHREVVADVQFQPLGVLGGLFQPRARIGLLYDVIDKQPLTQGSAEGIHHHDFALRIFFFQFPGGDAVAALRPGKPRGEGEHKHVPALFEKFLRKCGFATSAVT